MIKKRILSHKSDPECGYAYRGPLPRFVSGNMKVFIHSSELNKRCAVEKISEYYTNSRLANVPRYGLQKLWNRLRKNRKRLKMAENIHTVWTVKKKGKWEFERWLEEWKKNKDFGLGVWTLVGAFELLEAVQTQRKSCKLEGSNGGK